MIALDRKIDDDISIHAPVKGATWRDLVFPDRATISIHAPAKEATSGYDFGGVRYSFQSTLP